MQISELATVDYRKVCCYVYTYTCDVEWSVWKVHVYHYNKKTWVLALPMYKATRDVTIYHYIVIH